MKKQNLNDFMLSLVDSLKEEHRFGTAHVYHSALCSFQTYWILRKGKSVPMRMWHVFNPDVLQDFEQYLTNKQLSMNTISTYMRMLRAVYNRALRMHIVCYKVGLFDHIYTGTCADVKRALSSVDMARTLSSPLLNDELKETRMWFSLLFLLRGMPFADLARLRKCDYHEGVISYCRQKTGQRLVVIVPSEAKPLLRACADLRPESPYLLSILSDCDIPEPGSDKEYSRYQQVLRGFNHRLGQLSGVLRLGCKLSSYTARHTWATLAYHKKCPVGVISNALGHSSIKVTETYLKPFEAAELDKTNRMIISYVMDALRSEGINFI